MPDWAYNPERMQYRDLTTGRFTSREQVRTWVGESIQASGNATDLLTQTLSDGLLRVDDWQLLMRNEIKEEIARQYILGKGGIEQMTQIDWGSIGGQVAEQFSYLDDFAEAVAQGRLSERD